MSHTITVATSHAIGTGTLTVIKHSVNPTCTNHQRLRLDQTNTPPRTITQPPPNTVGRIADQIQKSAWTCTNGHTQLKLSTSQSVAAIGQHIESKLLWHDQPSHLMFRHPSLDVQTPKPEKGGGPGFESNERAGRLLNVLHQSNLSRFKSRASDGKGQDGLCDCSLNTFFTTRTFVA